MRKSTLAIILAGVITPYSYASQAIQAPLLIFEELAERPSSALVADLDGNGVAEIILADNGGNYLTVLTVHSATDIEVFQRLETGSANGVGIHDVDGDNHQDLIIDVGANISVYKGNSSGQFETSPSSSLQLARASTVIRFGDANGDGAIDIFSTSVFEDSITVLINDGTGTFAEAAESPFPTGQRSGDLEVGDLNGDQNIDIVTVNEQSQDLTILLGNGQGSFSPAGSNVVFNFSGAPTGINLEDWDLDGDADAFIVSCCSILPDGSLGTGVSVLESDGVGNFEELTNIPVGSNIGSLPTGDFDGDGDSDIALITADSTISILQNNGSGQFSLGAMSPPIDDKDPRLITVGDFSGDGIADVATINRTTDDLSILISDGSGGFSSIFPTALSFGVDPVAIALADINSDGKQDALVTRRARGDIQILRGVGNGLFQDGGIISLTGVNPRTREPSGIQAVDLNDDTFEDVVVAKGPENSVAVFLGDGAGGFSAAPGSPYPVNLGGRDIAVGDVDADGLADIAALGFSADAVAILLGNGAGEFTLAGDGNPIPVGDGPVAIKLFDLDSDGIGEIITTNQIDNSVSILKSDGSGGFVSALPSPLSPGTRPQDVDVGDFDGDGNQDLAVINGTGRDIAIFLGDSEFQFQHAPASPITLPGLRGENIKTADLDDDGDLDIVATYGIPNGTLVLLNDGSGQFTTRGDTPFPLLPREILVNDLDGDLLPDLFMFFDSDEEEVQAVTSDVIFTDSGEDPIIE